MTRVPALSRSATSPLSTRSVAYLHQDSVSQEADPTHCECHSDEKQSQRSARFSDKISASCDHEAYPCYPIASRQCDFRHIRDSAPFLDRPGRGEAAGHGPLPPWRPAIGSIERCVERSGNRWVRPTRLTCVMCRARCCWWRARRWR